MTVAFLTKIIGSLMGRIQRRLEHYQFGLERRFGGRPSDWKRRHPWKPPSDEMTVRFIVPLIPPAKAHNWERVCQNLQRTISSLRCQSNSAWTVTIACQTRPDGINFDDQVKFLPYNVPCLPAKSDKTPKLRALTRHLGRVTRADGYLYYLDGDDILNPRLVEYILSDNNGHGYYVHTGYLVDLEKRRVICYGGIPNVDHPFFMINGSVTALRFDTRAGPTPVYPALMRGLHTESHLRLQKFGFNLTPIPFPAVLYVFNHGDNLETHRNKDTSKVAALEQIGANDELFRQVEAEFGLITNHQNGGLQPMPPTHDQTNR